MGNKCNAKESPFQSEGLTTKKVRLYILVNSKVSVQTISNKH